jgi:hypothetical protein
MSDIDLAARRAILRNRRRSTFIIIVGLALALSLRFHLRSAVADNPVQQCVIPSTTRAYVCADGQSTVTVSFTATPCATAPYLGSECTTQTSSVDYPTTQATYGPYSSPTTQTYSSPQQNMITIYSATDDSDNCPTQVNALPTTQVTVIATGTWYESVQQTTASDTLPGCSGPFSADPSNPVPGYPNPLLGSNPAMTASGNVHQDDFDASVDLTCSWTANASAGNYGMSGTATGGETITYTWPCASAPPSTTFTLNGSVTLSDSSAGNGHNGNPIVSCVIQESQGASYSVGGPGGFLSQQAFSVGEYLDTTQAAASVITFTLPPAASTGIPNDTWPAPLSDQNTTYPFNGVNWNVPANAGSPLSATLTVKANAAINVTGGGGPQSCRAEAKANGFTFTHSP